MSFIEERLLEHVSYGFAGGPNFRTTKVQLRSGITRRNAERSLPLYKYRAPYNAIRGEHHSAVQSAYLACLGPVHGFRFKDWADYRLNNVVIGTADGTSDQELQIVKPYTFGGITLNRTIKKPVDSTVFNVANGYVSNAVALSVTANDTPIAFTIDYTTGIITLTGTDTHVIRVTGEFDVPVYFEDDSLDFDFVNWDAHSGEIGLVEDLAA